MKYQWGFIYGYWIAEDGNFTAKCWCVAPLSGINIAS
jgi:hypothetical protein